jgi:hypothetical protein
VDNTAVASSITKAAHVLPSLLVPNCVQTSKQIYHDSYKAIQMEKHIHTLKRGETGMLVFRTNVPRHEEALRSHVEAQHRAFLVAKDKELILYSDAESVQQALRASVDKKGELNRAFRSELGLNDMLPGAAGQLKFNGSAEDALQHLTARRGGGELIVERGFTS